MEMTEGEICRSYKQAKSKKSQIKILADLNCTTNGTIEKILVDNNLCEPTKPKQQKKYDADYKYMKRLLNMTEDELTEKHNQYTKYMLMIMKALEIKSTESKIVDRGNAV